MNYGFGDVLTLIGSLGLFLYGMKVMSDALTEVVGDRLREILASMTSNRVLAVFTGFLITSVIQSSSATTLMVVSFANASLLTLTESIGVIMGANIGTTVTAWLITILGFKVSMSALALPLAGVGFFLTFSKKNKVKQWGLFIVGFAILFIGLQFLKDSVPDIKQHPEILEWLKAYTDLGFWSVLLFLLIGTALTIIIQSSSATMALTLVMCHEGWIPFDMAAAMVLGENLGTTITANLAAIVGNYSAKRTARAHLIFNVLGVVWMVILIQPFLRGVEWFVQLDGGSSPFRSPKDVPVALSVFHTSFNIINTFLLIWWVRLIARVVGWMVPQKEEILAVDQPKYLDKGSLKYPQTAIQVILLESKRLLEGPTFKIIAHSANLHRKEIRSEIKTKKVVKSSDKIIEVDVDELYYRKVKNIYSKIVEYCTQVNSKFHLPPTKSQIINKAKLANRHMVKAIKKAKQLQKSMDHSVTSENILVQKAYHRFRKKITRVLREIHKISTVENPQVHLQNLERLKSKVRQKDILVDGTLDEGIRNNQISSQEGTSLSNDSDLVSEICENLIEAIELLYVETDTLLKGLSNDDLGDAGPINSSNVSELT
ncbi:MAG: Na/Pi cotransporter family protein [Saprospiraceae bacterium]|nr:Na/Pi cotransporter family protein [Saprospiraceae bacterium]